MKIKGLKNVIAISLIFTFCVSNILYARNRDPFAGEVSEPSAEAKVNKSESTIIVEDSYSQYDPLHTEPSYVNNDDYKEVDNFNVDLKTIENRIKYFSPTYQSVKSTATTGYWTSYYVKGGNDQLMYDQKSFVSDYKDAADEFKTMKVDAQNDLKKLDTSDPNYTIKKTILEANIYSYTVQSKTYMTLYSLGNETISTTKSSLGLKATLQNIANIDNNTSVTYARNVTTQKLSQVVLTYLQLSAYVDILEKSKKTYKDMYELTLKNYDLGLSTAVDVQSALSTYETTKATCATNKSTMQNLKEQICINLGYDINDMDKLCFIEPEVDLDSIAAINIDNDRDRAYNSNSTYQSISMSGDDTLYPQSTGEALFYKRQNYTAQKIIVSLEDLYQKLLAALNDYNANIYLDRICEINDAANVRKLNNNLVSKLEFDALEIKNLSNKLQSKIAKYNLISAYNNYHYGALGNIDIS